MSQHQSVRWESLEGTLPKAKFSNISTKLASRADVHAFILLDQMFPKSGDIISASKNNVIYLDITDDMIETLSDEVILELINCGVLYSSEYDCLYMFT